MGYESDFVDEELISFEIEGRVFKYKPITGGDELKWVKECLHIENQELVRDPRQTALCKMRNILEVPYTQDDIKNVIGVEKEWLNEKGEQNLTDQEKDIFWSKMKPALVNSILVKIQEIESGSSEVKKN